MSNGNGSWADFFGGIILGVIGCIIFWAYPRLKEMESPPVKQVFSGTLQKDTLQFYDLSDGKWLIIGRDKYYIPSYMVYNPDTYAYVIDSTLYKEYTKTHKIPKMNMRYE